MCDFDIVFIAGVHGVGKTALCSEITHSINIPAFSASSIIRNVKKSATDVGKQVIDADKNQDHLIVGLKNLAITSKAILLDGHFCLLGGDKIIDISINTFKSMPLSAIVVLFDSPEKINNRLLNRDGSTLNVNQIDALQVRELELAKETACQLNIPIKIISPEETSDVVKWVREIISTSK